MRSTWAPEPQKPSAPWVAEKVASTFGAERSPMKATSVERLSPFGPFSGFG